MDNKRLRELARHNLVESGFTPLPEFEQKTSTEQREKLLWQWATAKQMTFKEWQAYLRTHVGADMEKDGQL